MAEIVNLRMARKHKKRADKEKQAEENRVKFGRSKRERQKSKAVSDLEKRKLDGLKREIDD